MRILIVEDEFNLADIISNGLKKEKYIVDIETNGEDGLYKALSGAYNLIILDVMLPYVDGFEILKSIRDNNVDVKVIMLTAKSELDDKLLGFNYGADDYVTKPFHLEELIARVNVQLRKDSSKKIKDYIETFDLRLNIKTSRLFCIQTTDSIDMSINTDDDDEKIDWSLYEKKDYELSESITINNEGVYHLTGIIENGMITIKTSGNVKLVLDNVSILNSSSPAIFVQDAEDVVIELLKGSTNYLEDGASYVIDQDEAGVIYSKSDLTIMGEGSLEIVANNQDAVVSKDDLKIVSGTYKICSKDDGIRGKDSVYIQSGTFTINSNGDGIKATNNTDVDKGFVMIENGTFNINAEFDGIQAETKMYVINGEFDIVTGGGSANSSNSNENWGQWGEPRSPEQYEVLDHSTSSASAIGIKAADNLVIENGIFNFDTSDDAMHCNNNLVIKNGSFAISSGDDGIHADNELIIDNGDINVTKSYEGIEASKITINDGELNVIASDDGINVAGGNDSSAMGRPGQNSYSENSNNMLIINGGNIYVNSQGDGLDANGSIYMNGGYVKIDGPSNNGNGALDYDKEFVVNGGTLIAGGASGMAQGLSTSSKLYNIMIIFDNSYGSDDIIIIEDSTGKEIASYSSSKTYSSLVMASTDFIKDAKYTIKVNGSEYTSFTISSISINIGNVERGEMNNAQGERGEHGGQINPDYHGGPGIKKQKNAY